MAGLRGIGAFAEGLSEGYDRGLKNNMAIKKEQREQEAFEMDKQIKQNQLEEIERKKAMQEQIKRDLVNLNANAAGGTTGGEATDEFGVEIGKLVYSNPADAKASGLKFKEGTTVEAAPITDLQKNRATFEIMKKARIDHGFMDEESWNRSMDMTKKLKKEGVEDAFSHFLTTGDSEGAMKIFSGSGSMKPPKGSFLKREVDPQTGVVDVGIYIPGKDGQPELYTTMNNYLLMTNSDALVKHYAEMKKSKFEQGEATKRTGIETKGKIDSALISAAGKDGGKTKDDRVKERIDKLAFDFPGKLANNPSISYNIEEFQRNQPKIAARAYQYMTGRVEGQKGKFDDEALAFDRALEDILGKPKK
jgi:hypothetical protein